MKHRTPSMIRLIAKLLPKFQKKTQTQKSKTSQQKNLPKIHKIAKFLHPHPKTPQKTLKLTQKTTLYPQKLTQNSKMDKGPRKYLKSMQTLLGMYR